MKKIFNNYDIDSNLERIVSMEEMIEMDFRKEEVLFKIDESIEISNKLDQINLSIIALESSILKDKKEENRDIYTSLEEYKTIANDLGYENPFLSSLTHENYLTLSFESVFKEKEDFLSRLNKLNKMFRARFTESLQGLVSIFSLFSDYNTNKLNLIKEQIKNGTLIPRDKNEIDEKINKKFGVMYAFGYDVEKSTKGLIEYMQLPIDNINKNNFYTDKIKNIQQSLMLLKDGKEITKDKEAGKLFSKLKGFKSDYDFNSDDFKTGFIMKMFSDELSLMSIARNKPSNKGNRFIDRMVAVHADIYTIEKQTYKDINPLSKEEVIKLIDFGISVQPEINKALSTIKYSILSTFLKQIVNAIADSVNIVPGQNGLYHVLVGRFADNLMTHILILSKDLVKYDKLIIDYINATYKKK